MVVSGSLPNWDEAHRYVNQARDSQGNSTYNKLASYRLQPFHRDFGSARTKRAGYVGSIQDLMDIVGEALIDFQSYHMVDEEGNPWEVQFPNAQYTDKGDKIKNLTTGEVYKIRDYIDKPKKILMLQGNIAPKTTDKLRLEGKNYITFTHGYPASLVSSHKIVGTSEIVDQAATFDESIRWIVTRSQPASEKNAPPFSIRALVPKHRETVVNPENPDELLIISGMRFDSLITFTVWTRTNSRAEELITWFELFMDLSKWIIELYAGSDVYYWAREVDEHVYVYRNDLTERTVKFHFRHERLYWSVVNRLREVSTRISIDFAGEDNEVQTDDILLPPDQDHDQITTVSETE